MIRVEGKRHKGKTVLHFTRGVLTCYECGRAKAACECNRRADIKEVLEEKLQIWIDNVEHHIRRNDTLESYRGQCVESIVNDAIIRNENGFTYALAKVMWYQSMLEGERG